MVISEILAKIIGLNLFLFSFVLLFNKQALQTTLRLLKSKEFMLLTGFGFVFLGLVIVVIHNIWEWSWRVIVTSTGWLFFLEGLIRVTFPSYMVKTLKQSSKLPIKISLYLTLFVGGYLIWAGFF